MSFGSSVCAELKMKPLMKYLIMIIYGNMRVTSCSVEKQGDRIMVQVNRSLKANFKYEENAVDHPFSFIMTGWAGSVR